MKGNFKLVLGLVFVLAVELALALKVSDAQSLPAACASANVIDPISKRPIGFLTGPEFLDNGSMTLDGIRNYLRAVGSWLKGDDKGMVLDTDGQMFDFAKAVFDAAGDPIGIVGVSKKPINPQLLLAMVEKEQGMILKRTRPTQVDQPELKLLTGCGKKPGTTMRDQIQCAARTLRNRFDELVACADTPNDPVWNLNKPTSDTANKTQDGININPSNAATVAHFPYNPVAGIRWGGKTKYGGVARFCILWHNPVDKGGVGFANPPTALTLSSTNPTLTCSDPLVPDPKLTNRTVGYRNVTLSVAGGTPPYTWTVTRIPATNATIPACGANGEDAVLKPPANNPNVGGRAYWLVAHSGASNVSCILGATAIVGLGCDSVTQYTCFASTQNCVGAGCSAGIGGTCGPMICSDGPNCPGPSCGGDLMTYMMAHQSSAAAIDDRNQTMIKDGCKPCNLEMQGAVVTVKDANPNQVPVTATITVK